MDYQKLKTKLQEAIEEKNLTATEVERETGLSLASLRNFLTGRVKEPKLDVIWIVAQYLGLDLSHLLSDISSPPINNRNKTKSHKEPINIDLMKACTQAFCEILASKNILLDLDTFISSSKEIYTYCAKYGQGKMDTTFLSWYVDTHLS